MAEARTLLRAVIEATGLSRRKAFEAIRQGRVKEAGQVIVDPSKPYGGRQITLDGMAAGKGEREKVYLLLNKPPGVFSTTADERGRRTVIDVIPPEMRVPGLHPV